jgi:hypothetical protein
MPGAHHPIRAGGTHPAPPVSDWAFCAWRVIVFVMTVSAFAIPYRQP